MRIEVLDLHFQGVPQCMASFLLHAPQGPILIESGPSSCRGRLLQALRERGLAPADVKALLVTHIHLDHAGCAGFFAAQGVPIFVHHLGAPHLIEPSKLVASATRIYKDEMDTLWGEVLPVTAERIHPVEGDQVLQVAGLRIEAVETPGHARHHYAFAVGGDIFTGDAAGVRLPVPSAAPTPISVTAPPPEFDLENFCQSLDKLAARQPERLYLTHYGPVEDCQAHLSRLRERAQEVAGFVKERREWERDKLVRAYYDWHAEMGIRDALFDPYEKANPLFMSVDGLLRYWKKRQP